ncbi:hypothetical protein [Streptomyces sp. PT12]|uniref:hypothetical protein n=1 Tax=Streptomyces sp. PT12 TaxID=1510197 RepID=UPI000DE3B91D|nr:hypothetical protein [Streptomyces sp. PT12]RBM24217.1 hypothetical protein DEH69_00515 [Streptomyces sp. PT12]
MAVRAQYEMGGHDIGPDSLGIATYWVHRPDQELPSAVFGGAWRTDCGPSRIAVEVGGETHDATMLRLPGDPG